LRLPSANGAAFIQAGATPQELRTHTSQSKASAPDYRRFYWQRGYGAFSVSPSELDALLQYVDTQEEHHRSRTFQEEYREFLRKHGVEYDERFVWD
jgi:hypothetical protein